MKATTEMDGVGLEPLLTLRQTADMCNVSTRAIYRLLDKPDFPRPVRLSAREKGGLRFVPSEIRAYWDSHRAS